MPQPQPLEIGSIVVDPPLFLAPMAGVTDRDFRLIVRRIQGVGVVSMEFISSRAIVSENPHTRELLFFSEEERPLAIQIYGSEAATMSEAARIVEELGADICDINMGCPANKVLKGCAGAALMGDLGNAESIISSVRRAISIPLTVKFRLGLDDRRRNYLELGRVCEANGVAAVAMHGRTAKQGFRGEADWSPIARLKEALSIPVIGNGDVRTPADIKRMKAHTGCDGVMIGRAAIGNPWIFQRKDRQQVSLADRLAVLREHLEMNLEFYGAQKGLLLFRKHVARYIESTPIAARDLRVALLTCDRKQDFEALLHRMDGGERLLVAAG